MNVIDGGDSHQEPFYRAGGCRLKMASRSLRAKRKWSAVVLIGMEEIARDVCAVTMTMANAYLVGSAGAWVLVDSGTPGNEKKIKEAAEARFAPGARPRAILLTHGHFDHAGSSGGLAKMWDVPVYAHRLERPYLDGRSSYPPIDPTAPGFFSNMSRLFPSRTVNVGDHLRDFANSLSDVGMGDWEIVDTPGHSPGHVAFYRRSDGVLLAGDALTTMNLDSFLAVITKRKEVCRPPTPATTDWGQARQSVERLAALRPRVIGAGHGLPMQDAADELAWLAEHFRAPGHGRYVQQPARADESGVTYLPPAPMDPMPRMAAGVAAGIAIAAAGAFVAKRARS